jgi:hypothetical protein
MGWKICDRCREIEEGSPAIGDMLRALGEMRQKHHDLVRYATKYRGQPWGKAIEKQYPVEIGNLGNGDNFDHGFHSGVLAGLRFVAAAMTEGVEAAKAKFPELDT